MFQWVAAVLSWFPNRLTWLDTIEGELERWNTPPTPSFILNFLLLEFAYGH